MNKGVYYAIRGTQNFWGQESLFNCNVGHNSLVNSVARKFEQVDQRPAAGCLPARREKRPDTAAKTGCEVTMVRYAVLTSSDMGAAGKRQDTSGDTVVEMMSAAGHELVERTIVPDERPRIVEKLRQWSFGSDVEVVLTTGGTGLGPRDVTPEATADVVEYEVPGIAEAMRAASLQVTPMAMISRAKAGVRGRTLIINLPGSPGGVRDNLAVVLPVLEHAVEILRDRHSGPHPV